MCVKKKYFLWLCDLVDISLVSEVTDGYIFLLKRLYEREFYWTVEMDSNRAEDGKNLRLIYSGEQLVDGLVPEELKGPCSVLEMMIALAVRWNEKVNSDIDSDHSSEYFWRMIHNLGLEGCTDDKFDPGLVDRKIDILLERGYTKDGVGGLFPLKTGKNDVRHIELWYQLQAYLIENDDLLYNF